MAKIFVTRKIPGGHLEKLKAAGHEVMVSPHDRPLTREELLQAAVGTEALLCLLTDKIDSQVMDTAGRGLKVISSYAVGFDNIDVAAATERGIVVCNTPSDEVNEAVAEHTWALILGLTRRIVEADEATKRGAYKGWEPEIFLGKSLIGKTLGIVGLGRIGGMVARRAAGFGMTLLYTERTPNPQKEKEVGAKYVTLADLFATSDVVSLHVPLTSETKHLLNKETIAKMKQGAYLVNTARGGVVDEHALAEALRTGHLAGAALDVYEEEPNINPELIGMENVILTPHIASATFEAREKMGEQAVGAILAVFAGQKPENLLNQEVWDKRRQ